MDCYNRRIFRKIMEAVMIVFGWVKTLQSGVVTIESGSDRKPDPIILKFSDPV